MMERGNRESESLLRNNSTHERSGSRTRRPFHHAASVSMNASNDTLDGNLISQSAQLARYRYYGRLSGYAASLHMPDHIVPPEFFMVIPLKSPDDKQSSIVTIFSLWNTMMGTSILTMPWALSQAGFANGICLLLVMGGLAFYTAYKTMKATDDLTKLRSLNQPGAVYEFTDVCRVVMGRWVEWISLLFSLLVMVGAVIVYWVLMTNFLYHTGHFIYHSIYGHDHQESSQNSSAIEHISCANIVCHSSDMIEVGNSSTASMYTKLWDERRTVPFWLILLVAPTLSLKSPTFFTKFNALGTISVMYLLSFLITKVVDCGPHVDFTHTHREDYVPEFSTAFPALTGTLSLAMFSHTAVNSVMRTQRTPQNNNRDLAIAYLLVSLTYLTVAVIFYIAFPLPRHSCLQDNLLNNFGTNDILTAVARMFLLFQMFCVFPLLAYIVRVQTLMALFGSVWPSLKHVVCLNLFLIASGVLFAVFYPQVGTIIRFSGAASGLCLMFTLPCAVSMIDAWSTRAARPRWLTYARLGFDVAIVLIGLANFVGQFLIIDSQTRHEATNHNHTIGEYFSAGSH